MALNNQKNASQAVNQVKVGVKKVLNKFSGWFSNWKYVTIVFVILLCTAIGFAGFMIWRSFFDVKNLNERSEELNNLKNYNISILNSNKFVGDEISNMKTLDELIDYNVKLEWMSLNFESYLKWIQSSYDNFLSYILLPSLNIWKDPFLWEIDYSIIWTKFLEKNPYNDIDLISKWSDFIKDAWNQNEYNEIDSIEIWEMVEEWDEFYIPVTVSYVSPSYRWLLLLIEKLSVTSNQKNISLINEFVYNMWQVIKEKNSDEIVKIQEIYTWFSEDQAIWFILYNWVKWDMESSLINDEIVNETIEKVAICSEDEAPEYCYYKFRDKYRNLPSLAYTIWLETNPEKVEYLRNFFRNLPQIIKIISFTYDGQETTDAVNYVQKQYKGTIDFRIYWDALHDDEVLEIQNLLGWLCLWTDLTPETALSQINSKLTSIWKDTNIDTYTTTRLMELESLISDIFESFDSLSNYKKVIKTFEMYRMLSEWNVCNL